MSEQLIIRLRCAGDDIATWVVVDMHGRRVGEVRRGTLTDAASLAAGRRMVVLVPGTEVMLCTARLPIRNHAKLLKALPYSLEDQLAEDVETLHFAAGRPDDAGVVPVAITSRAMMQAWRDRLMSAGLQADAMVADSQAVPANPGSLTVVLDGARVYLVPTEGLAQVFEGLTLAQALDLVQGAGALRRLLVYCEAHHDKHLADYWQELRKQGIDVDVHLHSDGGLSRMAAGVVSSQPINLLQGEFAPRGSYLAVWQQWRVAAVLLAGFALIAVLGKAIEYQRLSRALSDLDTEIHNSFRRSFGEIPVSDYRLQTRQQLARLRGDGADMQLLGGLDALGQTLAHADNTRLLAVSYRRGVLDLRLRAPDVATLDRIQRHISEVGGGRAEIQAANPVDGGVEGRLQITPGGGA